MSAHGSGAHETACAFINAIVWSEHLRIWDLLSPEAREYVLDAASRKGMDAVAIERARQGTWNRDEADLFLRSLVHGLRVDLSGVDLDHLVVMSTPNVMEDGALRFELQCPSTLPAAITGGANWAAGAVIMCSVPISDPSAPPTPSTPTTPSTAPLPFGSEGTPVVVPLAEWRVRRLVPRPATRPAS